MSSVLFDTVAKCLAMREDLVDIEQIKIEVTDDGFTVPSNKGTTIRCATTWKDQDAFEYFLVDRLVS